MLLTRRHFISGLASALAAPAIITSDAHAFLEVRGVNLVNHRTGEKTGKLIYFQGGRYYPEALDEINHILRDWRENEVKRIDRDVIDFLSRVHQRLNTNEPLVIISGYRTERTNSRLRGRTRRSGVARNSLHTLGQAIDFSCPSRSVRQISGAARSLRLGGVGTYSRSGFVHIDSGRYRTWGT